MIRRLRRLAGVPADLVQAVVTSIPGATGRAMRRWYWGRRMAFLGRRVAIDEGVRIDHPERISIGEDTWIDRGVILIAGEPRPGRETRELGGNGVAPGMLRIGARCHIGPYTILSGIGGLDIGDEVTVSAGGRVYSLSHHYRSFARPDDRAVGFGSMLPDDRQAMLIGPVVIGRNAGLAADCLVLPGVTIGEDSFVLPRSLVRTDIEPGVLAGGDPAVTRGPRYATSPPDGMAAPATAGE